jgi:hypothetical protein
MNALRVMLDLVCWQSGNAKIVREFLECKASPRKAALRLAEALPLVN